MKALTSIIKRNLMVYCKDYENVFYTFLSTIIIIILMLLFLGDLNIDIVRSVLNNMDEFMKENPIPQEYLLPGTRNPEMDYANARTLMLSLLIGGITIVNGISASMGMLSMMSWDEESGKFAGFFVAPISRFVLVTGYVISAICLSVIFSLFTAAVSELILLITGGTVLTVEQMLKVLGLILLNAFSTTSFLFFITGFAKTRSAFNGISNFVYVLSGFVTGMYIPVGYMPGIVKKVLVFVPMTQGSAWMRKIFTDEALYNTFAGLPKEVVTEYGEISGITMKLGDKVVTPWMQFALMFGSGILFLVLSAIRMRKKNVRQ
ncbi:MAG TPA: ABC transporter permease [Mobilitalea sp.]|nr:ABC transporter permease [Mobilitalea sp.]